jgi:hypothetical protein
MLDAGVLVMGVLEGVHDVVRKAGFCMVGVHGVGVQKNDVS